MTTNADPRQNALLAALPDVDLARLLPRLELVPMPAEWAVYEAGGRPTYAYFPTSSVVSLLHVMEDGVSAEVAVCGNDGLVGFALFMGGESTSSRAMVIVAGYGYRLRADILKAEFSRSPTLQRVLLRYTQALLTQMAQTAACNRRHSVEQHFCRFLLLGLDRLPSNALSMTHELIANILGVRREGVTEAAGKLQDAGVIKYRRGHITVLSRSKLEARACECYTAVKSECDRLLCSERQRGTGWAQPVAGGAQYSLS